MATENKFPTISDARRVLASLEDRGLGDLPVQMLLAPDSTIQALARDAGSSNDSKPALMLDFKDWEDRLAFCIVNSSWLERQAGTPRSKIQ